MRKLLIGPVLSGTAWIAGSHYGANAQQVVHKSPEQAYEAVSDALAMTPDHGTTAFEGGKPMPYELRFDREPGQQIVLHILFAGREGARTEIDFTPQAGGTLMTATAHGDRGVLSDALAGTENARVAYAPDWMLNLLMVRPLLQQLGQEIEAGKPPQIAGMNQADWESSLPPDEQKQVQAYRQYEAAAPTVDPNADAENYMNGSANQATSQ